jgi:hypothetical protein
MSDPAFSTDPQAICRACGVQYGYGPRDPEKPQTGYLGPDRSVVVTWTTDAPADGRVRFRMTQQQAWRTSYNPEPTTDHRFVLSQLIPGAKYEMLFSSVHAAGRSARTSAVYELIASPTR